MSNAPHDLRDYVLDELTPPQRAEVERFLAASVEAREEVERLRLTHQALLSLPEEEPPRRIAFVSDKVFEPSLSRRLWQSIWQGAPRLAFGMAAVLLVFFAGAWATQPTVTSDSSGWRLAFGQPARVERPAVAEAARVLTPEQVRQVSEILRESEARNQEAIAELVRLEGARAHGEMRSEIEQIRQASEENFQIQKARWDKLQLDLNANNTMASFGR
jgi:ferric-dicitrate binding protein FerR (iron transport regulator)